MKVTIEKCKDEIIITPSIILGEVEAWERNRKILDIWMDEMAYCHDF